MESQGQGRPSELEPCTVNQTRSFLLPYVSGTNGRANGQEGSTRSIDLANTCVKRNKPLTESVSTVPFFIACVHLFYHLCNAYCIYETQTQGSASLRQPGHNGAGANDWTWNYGGSFRLQLHQWHNWGRRDERQPRATRCVGRD